MTCRLQRLSAFLAAYGAGRSALTGSRAGRLFRHNVRGPRMIRHGHGFRHLGAAFGAGFHLVPHIHARRPLNYFEVAPFVLMPINRCEVSVNAESSLV